MVSLHVGQRQSRNSSYFFQFAELSEIKDIHYQMGAPIGGEHCHGKKKMLLIQSGELLKELPLLKDYLLILQRREGRERKRGIVM